MTRVVKRFDVGDSQRAILGSDCSCCSPSPIECCTQHMDFDLSVDIGGPYTISTGTVSPAACSNVTCDFGGTIIVPRSPSLFGSPWIFNDSPCSPPGCGGVDVVDGQVVDFSFTCSEAQWHPKLIITFSFYGVHPFSGVRIWGHAWQATYYLDVAGQMAVGLDSPNCRSQLLSGITLIKAAESPDPPPFPSILTIYKA